MLLSLAALLPHDAQAQTSYTENFTGDTTSLNWTFLNGACLMASSTPSSTTAPGCVGLTYYANKGDFRRAIEDFDAAIKLSPDDVDQYVARGAANEELGNEAAARADYRKALEIDPDNEDAQEALSRLGN